MDIIIAECEGVPNITGSALFRQNTARTETEGAIRFRDAISSTSANTNSITGSTGAMGKLDIDASRISSVYRNTGHILPNSVACTYWQRRQ